MDQIKLEEYARLIVDQGLNVKARQLVVISAPVEAKALVRAVSKAAFERHAGDVVVRYKDDVVEKERLEHADDAAFDHVPDYDALFFNETAKDGACYLNITGNDPDLMKGVDMTRLVEYRAKLREATKLQHDKLDHMEAQWCVAACATPGWAQKVYPELSFHDAIERLWNAIFDACRVEPGKTKENWERHNASFVKKVDLLNGLDIASLHYKNKRGTDLVVKLPDGYRFAGGSSTLRDARHTVYFPNIPTEEVFSAPYKYGVDGVLYATMPLIYNGSVIEDFHFRFQEGKVVDFDARTGRDVLEAILKSDRNAAYLGEVALVPVDSPISKMDTIFYNTLFDENASCHFALGAAYLECVCDGLELREDQMDAVGLNDSRVHVDFMVGSEDLSIVATLKNGAKVDVFKNGNWVPEFE